MLCATAFLYQKLQIGWIAKEDVLSRQLDCWRSDKPGVAEWLGEGGRRMAEEDMEAPDLVYARSMEYDLNCNWKVFCDNYLVRALPVLPGKPGMRQGIGQPMQRRS